MEEKNRQTGRTSRIIDYVIEQLFSVGECISTDHVYFEFENLDLNPMNYFIEKVKARVENESYGHKTIDSKIIKLQSNDKNIYVTHFILINKN